MNKAGNEKYKYVFSKMASQNRYRRQIIIVFMSKIMYAMKKW